MVYCCVPFCKSSTVKKNPDISFHEIPSDLNLREEWLKRISRKDFCPNDNSNSTRVCSLHFKDDDFVPGLKYRRLKSGTVPTIFTNYPSYKIPAQDKPRRELKRQEYAHSSKRVKTFHENFDKNISACPVAEITMSEENDCQTDISFKWFESVNKEKEALRLKNYRLNEKLKNLQADLDECKAKLNSFCSNGYYLALERLISDASGSDESISSFILEQIRNYGKRRPTWSADTLKKYVAWQYCSPKGYAFVRQNSIFHLPSKTTLTRFVGTVSGETGVTPLIKERLQVEIAKLQEHEKFSSLLIDEMYIKAQMQYDKKIDCFFGLKDTNVHIERMTDQVLEPSTSHKKDNVKSTTTDLANSLLCFLLLGLSTSYRIPVAFFFSKQLSGKDLYLLTKSVIQQIEEIGFKIIRIVTDNHKTNVTMMKKFSQKKTVEPSILHPLDSSRQLFFSFDPSHILKNIRNLFLERDMSDNIGYISSSYVKKLYEIQSNETVRPVRFLTRKHVAPSPFEKMNVKRAIQLFSPQMTAAISTLEKYAFLHPQASSFHGAHSTVRYMSCINKWFELHNISNRKNYLETQNPNKMQFFSITDDRLDWLENDFLPYIEEIKVASKEDGKLFLSQETYEALIITTRSTVLCTKYLLNCGFHFVLTRCFLSDPIELLFSCLRQMSGGNDMMDSRAVIFAINQILKTGILSAPPTANVDSDKPLEPKCLIRGENHQYSSRSEEIKLSIVAIRILEELKKEPSPKRTTMKSATVAFIGGFIIKALDEKFSCASCFENLSQASNPSILLKLISNQDRGSLKYPKPAFVSVLMCILEFIEEVLEKNPLKENVSAKLSTGLIPCLQTCPSLQCHVDSNHSLYIAQFICEKFIPIALKNFGSKISEKLEKKKYLLSKPLNRKIHKI